MTQKSNHLSDLFEEKKKLEQEIESLNTIQKIVDWRSKNISVERKYNLEKKCLDQIKKVQLEPVTVA